MRALLIVVTAVVAAHFALTSLQGPQRSSGAAAGAVRASTREECRRYAAVFAELRRELLTGQVRTESQYRRWLKDRCRPPGKLSLHDRAFLPVYRILQGDSGKRWDIRRAAATAGKLERAFSQERARR